MRHVLRLVALLAMATFSVASWAWIYPEHRDLAVLAVERLDPERRAEFDQLWQAARVGDEGRLCAAGADTEQGLAPSCIDWAAMSAISGDHSCSGALMLDTVTKAPWILQVADVAAQLKVDLARIPATASPEATPASAADLIADTQRRLASQNQRAARLNALRTADLRLQRADAEYATRAGSNNAHFLLPRPSTDTTAAEYAQLTLRPGSEISALGSYAYYHLSALQAASRLAHEQLDPAQRDALARAALADEAFALHFLEDVYSAGHVAGTWGTASQRQGTHDYYNENGLEVFTWNGGARSTVLMGDARMRPQDADVASTDVRKSLEQVLDVAVGRGDGVTFPYTPAAPATADDFNVCRNNQLPQRPSDLAPKPEVRPFFVAVLKDTPVPGLGPGLGSMPRFRSEVGVFLGLAGAADGRVVDGGFAEGQGKSGFVGGLDISFRAGMGLDGVMNEGGDGLVFASIGLRSDTPSTNKFNDTTRGIVSGNLNAAIPARTALATRLRMPFCLVPGDLVLLSPLYFISPETYTKIAVTAANGGLLPWQTGWASPIGRFQFVLGREIGISWYGLPGHDQLGAPPSAAGDPTRLVTFKSILYDFPIAEFRPYRAFSMNQSSSVIFQLFYDFDVPQSGVTNYPVGAPNPHLHTVHSFGLRMVFDWRYYRW
jgi:hypothetical protein